MQGSWPGVPRAAKSHVPSRKIKAPKQNITKPDGCPTCLAVYRDKVAGAVGRWTNRQMPAGSLSGTSSPVPHTEAEWAPGPFRHARSSGPLFWGPCASSFPRLYAELWRAWQNDVFSMEAGRTMLDI